MLNIIQGGSGSGKTRYVTKLLSELARGGSDKLLYLIPEQSSFESEKMFLKELGPQLCRRVNVMSFTRLYDMVMRSTGGFSGTAIDDGVKRIIMSLALEDCRDELELYGRQALKPQLAELMLDAVREFKTCSVTSDMLREKADANGGTELAQKLTELALINDVYNAYIAQSYIDPLDNNARLEKRLAQVKFFEGYTIAVDGFTGFTAQEMKIVDLLMEQAENFYITLGMGGNDDNESLFFTVSRTKKQIMRNADRLGIPIASPVRLTENHRVKSREVRTVESGIYRMDSVPYVSEGGRNCESVCVAAASDIFEECSYVAESIYKLAVGGECRYRDIAVVCRKSENYRGILDAAFESRGIPYFMSKPQPIDTKPVILLVLSAFEYVITGGSEKLFSIAKCGLVHVTAYETALLENYAYIWNLNGRRFKEKFTSPPDGYGKNDSAQAEKKLAMLNEIRERLMTPLMDFEEKIRQGGSERISRAVYELLIDYGVDKSIRNIDDEFAGEEIRLWDYLMDLLNKMYLSLGERNIEYKRYYELFRSVVRSADISEIPQTLDQVIVGTADSIRLSDPYAVFVIGAINGEFPHVPVSGGVFSDMERRRLISLEVPLYDAVEELFLQEKYLVYNAVSAPTDKLFVTYYTNDLKGTEVQPSDIVSEVCRLLPDIMVTQISLLDDMQRICSEKSAFEECTLRYSKSDPVSAALREYFSSDKKYKDILKAVDKAVKRKDYKIYDKALAEKLFGSDKKLSASQIESFYMCRFRYFCSYGLRLSERRRASLGAIEYGSLVHYLLENVLEYYKEHDYVRLSDDELSTLLDSLMEKYMREELGGTDDKSDRFTHLYNRIKKSTQLLLERVGEELEQSEFRPVDFELTMGKDPDGLNAYTITDCDNNTVSVRGIIDRVDLMKKNGVNYVRIVDYKTGSKEFKLSDILYGLNMQMLIYLSAITKNGAKLYGGEIIPGGVLYMPSSLSAVTVDPDAGDEEIRKEHDKKLRMNGLILDDFTVYEGMEKELAGRFIPISVKKSGELYSASNKSLITRAQMDMVFDKVDRQISRMSEELSRGRIEAVPVSGSYSPCDWCAYGAVCARESGELDVCVGAMDKKEVLKALEKEKNNGEEEQ